MRRIFTDKSQLLIKGIKLLRAWFFSRHAIVSAALLLVIIVVLAGSMRVSVAPDPQEELLGALPAFEPGSPAAVITALRGEFPQDLARLLFSGASPPDRVPAAAAFIPMFDAADAMALVVTERTEGPAVYGVFIPAAAEYNALRSGVMPKAWRKGFASPSMRPTDVRNLYRLTTGGGASVYVLAEDGRAYVTDSPADAARITDVRGGVASGIKRRWSLESGMGRAYFSDGGLISSMTRGSGAPPNPKESLELEVSWVTSGDARLTNAKWLLSGADHIVARTFLNDLKPHDWSGADVLMPDPLVLSFGINLPNPGRMTSNLPSPLKHVAEQMRKLGLRDAETQAMLTGPVTFSLGGRTQLLWFDLPGIAVDIPGRGETAFKLIDKFWSETFSGTVPEPVDGYSRGGMTNLPFTVLAAANDDRAILGLVPPDADQNQEARDLLSNATAALAWVYADFPRLGASLLEIPALNSMMYEEDEEHPLDEESAGKLNNTLSALGRVFVMWESASSGSAICYY
jgi:hypothetical protein